MDMGSASSSATATSTMAMGMNMPGMGSMSTMSLMPSSSDMAMGMDMDMSMEMFFVKSYNNIPVLFSSLKANTGAKAFGIFVLLFLIGIFTRGVEFLRTYLEQRVWRNVSYIGDTVLSEDDVTSKISSTSEKSIQSKHMNSSSTLIRNFVRLVLCFVPEMFGFALMLAAMSFTPLYFFGAVAGLSVGRFIFERLSERVGLKVLSNGYHC